MPWVKKEPTDQLPWIVAIVAVGALSVGLLIGYAQWGSTAAVVGAVEKELSERENQMKHLERRLSAMEAIVLKDGNETAAPEKGPQPSKNSEASASKNGFRRGLPGPVQSKESRL